MSAIPKTMPPSLLPPASWCTISEDSSTLTFINILQQKAQFRNPSGAAVKREDLFLVTPHASSGNVVLYRRIILYEKKAAMDRISLRDTCDPLQCQRDFQRALTKDKEIMSSFSLIKSWLTVLTSRVFRLSFSSGLGHCVSQLEIKFDKANEGNALNSFWVKVFACYG